MPSQKPYGLLSIFAFILAGIGYLVHMLANTAGYLTLHGANNISNVYGFDRSKAQEVFDLYFKYQTEFYRTFFDWTIGPFNNTAGYLAVLFAIAGIVFAILYVTGISNKITYDNRRVSGTTPSANGRSAAL